MKDLDAFLPGILPFAPGCATPTAHFGIRQAAIEFCERTRLWRSEDEFDVTLEGCEAVMSPEGSEILEFEKALFNDQPLIPKTTAWLDTNENGWRSGTHTGRPRYITQTAPDTVTLVPKEAGRLKMYLWLKPAQECTELPDFLAGKYRETIAFGALSRILIIPNQSFTNVEMAGAFSQMFETRLGGQSTKGSIGQQRAALRTKTSMF